MTNLPRVTDVNHLRRGVSVAVVLAALATLAAGACSDPEQEVTAVGDRSAAIAPYPVGEWVDLPASPLGSWETVNRLFLPDGSGFVEAGAATLQDGGRIETTREVARFDFAAGRYTTLPALPVTSGLGQSGAAVAGGHLVIVGQDCPPRPGASNEGVEYCAEGGVGAKVVLTLPEGGEAWREPALPDWLREYQPGTPIIVGDRTGHVVVSSGHEPARLGELDPASGEWTRLPDGPTPRAEYCLVGTDLVAYSVVTPAYVLDDGTVSPNEWWVLAGEQWRSLPPPVSGDLGSVACGRTGMFISGSWPTTGQRVPAWFVDPVAGTVAPLSRDLPYPLTPGRLIGDSAVLPPEFDLTATSLVPGMMTTLPGDTVPPSTGATPGPTTLTATPPLRVAVRDHVVDGPVGRGWGTVAADRFLVETAGPVLRIAELAIGG